MEKRYRIKFLHEYKIHELSVCSRTGNKHPKGWNLHGKMSYLHGKDVTDLVNENKDQSILIIGGTWKIWRQDIIEYTPEEEVVEDFKQY